MASTVDSIPMPNPTSPAWNIYVDNQMINFTNLTGGIDTVPLNLIDAAERGIITRIGIFGVEIGATGVTLIVMFIFANRQKLRSPLFLVNSFSLLFHLMSSISGFIYDDSIQSYGLGQVGLGALAQYSATSLWWNSTFEAVTSTLGDTLINVSLILQVHAVFVAQPRIQKNITMVLSAAAIGGFALTVAWYALYERCVWIEGGCFTSDDRPPYDNIYIGAESILSAILAIGCIVLIGKLFISIRFRRQAGIRKFGVLHVLVITFGQCLIIPRILHLFKSKA